MLAVITLLAIGTPAIGLISYAAWGNSKANQVEQDQPSQPDWYK